MPAPGILLGFSREPNDETDISRNEKVGWMKLNKIP
jgi:hypothetical protein